MNLRRTLLLTALAGFCAGLAWPPPSESIHDNAEAEWRLPNPTELRRYDRAQANALRRTLHWQGGDKAPAGRGGRADKPFELLGVITAPAPTALFQQAGGGRLLRLRPGGALPDGSRVAAISGNQVILENDGCRRTLQLFRNTAVEASGDCPATAAEPH